jgi:hypothetical protein
VLPAAVCVEHSNAVSAGGGTVPVFFQANVTDQVFITAADYDPAGDGTLTVNANSSDAVINPPPVLTVEGFGTFTSGTPFVMSPLAAPPAKVRVTSEFLGSNEFQVTTGTGAAGGTLIAVADAATVAEDSGATTIDVLANDTFNGAPVAGATWTIVTAPLLGTGPVVGATGTGTISYTPNANAFGVDSFTYRISLNGQTSGVASVSITITPVNDPPVAVNDSFNAIAGVGVSLNVLANDTDVDGAGNIVAAANVTQPTPAGASVNVVAGLPVFTATAGGIYTFTYQAQDAAGAISANTATVTVTVAGAETITVQVAEFRTSKAQWRVSGVITPVPVGNVTINLVSTTNPGLNVLLGTVAILPDGTWDFRLDGATGQQDPRTNGGNRVRVTGPNGGVTTSTFLLRR